MLTMVFVIVPAGVTFAIWRSYRVARLRAVEGNAYVPDGKIRWEQAR